MKTIFLSFITFLLLSSPIIAQNRFAMMANIGATAATGEDLRENANMGIYLSAGTRFNLLQERLYAQPNLGLMHYVKKHDDPSHTDYFSIIQAATDFSVRIGKADGVQLFPFAKVAVNFINHTASDGQYSKEIIFGGGFSYGFGFLLGYRKFYLKTEYELLKPSLKHEQTAYGYPADKNDFDFSHVNFGLGYYFKRR